VATNVLLCRWTDGWREVKRQSSIDVIGRREAFLSLGAIETAEEVDRVANMQLDVVANPRMAIATDLAPMGEADRPYFAFNVGDTIGVPDYGTGTITQRVRALTGSEDDNGEITYSPEWGDLILEEQERTLQAVKKMSDGTLEGDSPVAQPRLRAQVQQIWKPPAAPPSDSPGATVQTTQPQYGFPDSHILRSLPSGDGTYTLTKFWCVPEGEGDRSELYLTFKLWQLVPGGDGNFETAYVSIGGNYQAGVEYVGFIYHDAIEFGPEHGIQFRSDEQAASAMTGSVYVAAEFEGGGTVVTVEWEQPTLRVVQHQ